jgi:hypothetical protein
MISAVVSGEDYLGSVVLTTGAVLLLWAGLPRLAAAGWRRRVAGVAEVLAAVAVLLLPGMPAAVLLGAVFLGFTAAHLRALDGEACDCFGVEDHVRPARAAILTGVMALLAFGAACFAAPSMRELFARDPAALAWLPMAAVGSALGWRLAFSGVAVLERFADGAGQMLNAGYRRSMRPGYPQAMPDEEPAAGGAEASDELIVRRSFLLRVAVVGSALASTPLRYLLYPGTALAAVVGPRQCRSGKCADGYTEFCCEINQGGLNACPADTFAGGWWMCTDYTGRQLCSEHGVRYYVDCNALPGRSFPGGCRCGNDDCANWRVACNIFRYGQCNTHIDGTTAVVCRLVLCENPATISELHCSAALATDNAVCGHEAPCLEPAALELVGAGGV